MLRNLSAVFGASTSAVAAAALVSFAAWPGQASAQGLLGGVTGMVAGQAKKAPTATAAEAPPYEYVSVGSGAQATLDTNIQCYLLETEPNTHYDISLSGNFDNYLAIGIGNTCETLRAVVRNDDAIGLNARVRFTASGGTYLVRVSGVQGGRGSYTLNVNQGQAGFRKLPPGVVFANAASANPALADGVSASTAPPSGRPAPPAGTEIRDCPECPVLVVVPAGSFMMGSPPGEEGRTPHEGPRHMVKFDRPFAIGKYEVTFDEFEACIQDKGCNQRPNDQGWGRGRRPVVDVSWNDASQYVRWLSRKTGQHYFLPSESEWEYAARAGTTTPWNTGNAIITDDANILNALGRTVPVGGYPANAFGVHDMHGNVQEWVADCYEVGYFGTPTNGGAMFNKGCKERVARSAAFDSDPNRNRLAHRSRSEPTKRYTGVGIRVARGL